uniref:Uncharacterized protein n=1 Tax=Anguilla anguilla TaxID=7936 RepID=A0A0E9XBU7_ANGAN
MIWSSSTPGQVGPIDPNRKYGLTYFDSIMTLLGHSIGCMHSRVFTCRARLMLCVLPCLQCHQHLPK